MDSIPLIKAVIPGIVESLTEFLSITGICRPTLAGCIIFSILNGSFDFNRA